MKTLLRIFLLLLVAALLVGVFLYVRNTENADSQKMEELYDRVEPLQQQKDELLKQKEKLTDDLTKDSRDPSTVQFLFRELDSELYTDVYPLMRERNIVGVLGVSGDLYEYPDGSYKITSEQFLRLLRDGWSACYMYSHTYDLEKKIKTNETILTSRSLTKLPPATAIYFSDAGDYVPEQMDPILKAHGIDTVILDADDGRSLAVTEVGDIWVTGAMPWSYTGVSNDIEYLARTDGGNLVWQTLPYVGRTLGAITANYPQPVRDSSANKQKSQKNQSAGYPEVSYRWEQTSDASQMTVTIVVKSTLDYLNQGGLRYAVSIDGGEEQTVNFNANLNEKPENIYSIYYPTVARRVVDRQLNFPAGKGMHTLVFRPISSSFSERNLPENMNKNE